MTAACPACTAGPAATEMAQAVVPNVSLSVPGIHCALCISKVERALNDLPGVDGARVNLTLKRVSAHADLPTDALVGALEQAGYDAYPLDEQVLGQDGDPKGRDLALRLGVAGFAMMNVMLLSVAVWSGAADATRDLFHLISAAISLPVVAFSGQPFFRSAWGALKVRTLNMDVPISLAILLACAISLYETMNTGHHAYFDAALSLTFFLLIGRYLDHRSRASARSAAKELAALEVFTAERLEDGKARTVPLAELVIGDAILVPTGTRIPVDGTLKSGGAVTDRAFLTGESEPITSARGDVIRAGEINLGAPFTLCATAVGEDTSLRRIARLVEQAENARNRFTTMADRAAQFYAPVVHLLALGAFLGWMIVSGGDLRLSINIAIAVLIITCPCALGLAVPAVSTAAIGKLYEIGFLVKSGTALERLAEVDRVIFDKTGTLTQPGITLETTELTEDDRAIALALAQHSSHPVSRALVESLEELMPAAVEEIKEVPGKGITGLYQGRDVRLGNGAWLGANAPGLALRIGDRVLTLGQHEALRPGAIAAAEALKAQGYHLTLLSGDAPSAVQHIADQLGIDDWHAAISPEDKHAMVAAHGARSVMVGDGLNDTPALAAAHASIAPSTALDASRNAADVVILRDGLAGIPTLLEVARKSTRLCKQNFNIATLYNVIAVPVALMGLVTPLIAAISMSTSSITVLLNALRVRRVSS
ncbi:MAG: heavy metal translocating P-type ATPase [Pseudomonadota bacterium]